MPSTEEVIAPISLTPAQAKAKADIIAAGNAAFDVDEFEKALDLYHRASILDGSDSSIWQALGLTYYNLEFPQEAWRSYKLALQADPENLDALWYAGEFLYNMDDLEMSRIVLKRYLDLETDPERIAEAEEMYKEATRQLGLENQGDEGVILFDVEDSELADKDEDELDGFDYVDAQTPTGIDDEDDFDDDLVREGDEDAFEESEEEFVASLALELGGMRGKCTHCSTPIPADAPYCYSCKAPHFYEDV